MFFLFILIYMSPEDIDTENIWIYTARFKYISSNIEISFGLTMPKVYLYDQDLNAILDNLDHLMHNRRVSSLNEARLWKNCSRFLVEWDMFWSHNVLRS